MCRTFMLLLIIANGYIAGMPPAHAAKITFYRQLEAGIGYTDNATRASPGSDTESEVSGVVTPKVSMEGTSRRSDFAVQGEFDLVKYQDSNTESSVNPRLFAVSESEIYEDLFFLNLSARANQISTDVFDPLGSGEIASDELSTAYDVTVKPYLNFVYLDTIEFDLLYQYSRVIVPDDSVSESNTQIVGFSILRNPREDNLLLGFAADSKQTEYPARDGIAEVKSISSSLGLVRGQHWLTTASVGSEWIRFPSDPDDIRTNTWDVGIRWLPSDKISIELGYGERSYGENPRAQLRFKQRRTQFSLYWTRGYANSNFFFSQNTELQSTGIPIGDTPDAEQESGGIVFTDSPIVDERIGMQFQLIGRLSEIEVNTIYAKRELQDQPTNSESWEVSARIGRQLGRSLGASLFASRREQLQNEFIEGRKENQIGVSVSYQF